MKMMANIREAIQHNIIEKSLISTGEHIGVAVSGGVDSMCLLHVLLDIQDDFDFRLTVLHFDHGTRGKASRQDAEAVELACKGYAIPFVMERADVPKLAEELGLSMETAARQARYHFFSRMTKEHHLDKIALAHHQDDQAETVLLNLIRGAGTKGLTGMRFFREPNYIRPMLDISKTDILMYAKNHWIRYHEDATNNDIAYSRNRVRQNILPELSAINSEALTNIARTADILTDEDCYLDTLVQQECKSRVSESNGEVSIKLRDWNKVNIAIKRRIIRCVLSRYFSLINLEFIHIAVIINISLAENGKRAQIMSNLFAAKTYDTLTIFRERITEADETEIDRSGASTVMFGGYRFDIEMIDRAVFSSNCECFDLDKMTRPIFRTAREGDYIVPLGMTGTKKLSDYLCDIKMPLHKRKHAIVMAEGSEVIWVVGYGISENYKVDDSTWWVMKVSANAEMK